MVLLEHSPSEIQFHWNSAKAELFHGVNLLINNNLRRANPLQDETGVAYEKNF